MVISEELIAKIADEIHDWTHTSMNICIRCTEEIIKIIEEKD